jgi:hypothetical protein
LRRCEAWCGGTGRCDPGRAEDAGILLCDLIISAFSALQAVAEAPPAVLAVDVDGDADEFIL